MSANYEYPNSPTFVQIYGTSYIYGETPVSMNYANKEKFLEAVGEIVTDGTIIFYATISNRIIQAAIWEKEKGLVPAHFHSVGIPWALKQLGPDARVRLHTVE